MTTWKHPTRPHKEPRTSWGLCALFTVMLAVLGWSFVAKALPQMHHDRAVAQEVGQ